MNDDRKAEMVERVARALGGEVSGKRIGVLGLAFKPNTDDMREAPSIPLIHGLIERGATVSRLRPGRSRAGRKGRFPGSSSPSDAYAAAEGADALVIVTEWDEFRALDLDRIAAALRGKVLVDLRNVYDRGEVAAAGLAYYGIGRGSSRGRLAYCHRFGSTISETDRPAYKCAQGASGAASSSSGSAMSGCRSRSRLRRKFDTTGFDIDAERIAELREGRDRTSEVDEGCAQVQRAQADRRPRRVRGRGRLYRHRPDAGR